MIGNLNIYEHVFFVSKRPAMFNVNSVEELHLYFLGYRHGMHYEGDFFSDFEEFINKKHGFNTEIISWHKLARLRSGSDLHSLELFRFWFMDFCEQKGIALPKE
jgi:hypothetical protein